MKKFRYRLETILKLRVREEEKQAQALSQCQRRVAQARQDLERLDQEWREKSRVTATALAGDLDLPRTENRLDHLGRLLTAVSLRRTDLRLLETELTARLRKYHDAARERKTLERLRDIKHLEHQALRRRAETSFFDFVGATAVRRGV
ncbi:MAG: flagellar FliJ family protein [Elusimicrobia bacterium]|nr:flagellar FliJ family protein [Elusimicrobiota bacterium]